MISSHRKILTKKSNNNRQQRSERRQTNYNSCSMWKGHKAVNNLFSSLSLPLHTCALVILTLFFFLSLPTPRMKGGGNLFFMFIHKARELKSGQAHLWQKKSLLLLFFRRKFSLKIVLFFSSRWETKGALVPYTHIHIVARRNFLHENRQ